MILKKGSHQVVITLAALVLLAIVALFCMALGSVPFSMQDSLAVGVNSLFGNEILSIEHPNAATIILQLRAPRVLLAGLVGASLAMAGAAMQGLLKNPLADGSTLGVTAGGALGAVLALAFNFSLPIFPEFSTAFASIIFSFTSLFLILVFAKRMDANLASQTIILTGVIFAMLASALTSLIIAFSGEQMQRIVFWTMGSFSGRGYEHLFMMAVLSLPAILLIWSQHLELDALALGEEQAAYTGVNVQKVRLLLLIAVAILCGTAVALCGSIAFIGLTIPHIVRMLTGPVHRKLLPLCLIIGAIFLMLCDLFSRTLLPPLELPIGVMTSIVGALTFVFIFYRQRGSNR